jgi:carboxypeptidase Q
MRRRARFARALPFLVFAFTTLDAQSTHPESNRPAWLQQYREPSARLIGEALGSTFAWDRLAVLTDTIGHRLSGSPALDRAIQWAVAEMTRDGLENVRAEKVMVPKWVRGQESAEIVEPAHHTMTMLGLGDSVGTRSEGVQGDVLVVNSFEELDARSASARGRIVLFNVPFTSYGETVRFRAAGPSRAARHGAIAALVRAVGPAGLRTPHTGALQYTSDAPKIPAAAITTEDADRLERLVARSGKVVVRLKMEAHFEGDVESANVIGEIRGREIPDEIVVVGGHLDSWDVGAGATDDGGGCVVTWEALRLMKRLNLRPKRTVRVVLWTNEENGLRGGLAYLEKYKPQIDNHVLMLESDGGVMSPRGFGFSGSDTARATVMQIASLLREIRVDRIGPSGGGADIGPTVEAGRIPAMSLDDDGNYFLIHHTPADTVDKIDPESMSRASAAIAVIAYVVADMPERLR